MTVINTIGTTNTGRNLLWNSGMNFRQRISSSTSALSAGYTYKLDRWCNRYDANGTYTGTPTIDQNTDVPSNNLTQYSLNFAGTPNGATAEADFAQRLEGGDTKQLGGKKVSVSFWVKTDCWTNVNVRISRPTTTEDTFSALTNIAATTVAIVANSAWQQVSVENIDLSAANTTLGLELRLEFTTATNTGAARFVRVAQVMFNVGEKAAPWNMRGQGIHEELMGCLRYYEKSYALTSAPGSATNGGATYGWTANPAAPWAANADLWTQRLRVPKRNSGMTVTIYSIGGVSDSIHNYTAGAAQAVGTHYYGDSAFTITSSALSVPSLNSNYGYHWTAECEL